MCKREPQAVSVTCDSRVLLANGGRGVTTFRLQLSHLVFMTQSFFLIKNIFYVHACMCHLVCLCATCMQEPWKARRGWQIPVVTKKLGREAEHLVSIPTLLGDSKECPSARPPVAIPSSATSDCASADTLPSTSWYINIPICSSVTRKREIMSRQRDFLGEKHQDFGRKIVLNFFQNVYKKQRKKLQK